VCTGLTLTHDLPRRPAAYGLSMGLDEDALVPGRKCLVEHLLRCHGILGDGPGDDEVGPDERHEPFPALREGSAGEVLAVNGQDIEEAGLEGDGRVGAPGCRSGSSSPGRVWVSRPRRA
jgi:hypothetical protein